MESTNSEPIPQDNGVPPVVPTRPFFPSGKREFLFALVILITGCFLCNSLIYGGLNLGFAVFSGVIIVSTVCSNDNADVSAAVCVCSQNFSGSLVDSSD